MTPPPIAGWNLALRFAIEVAALIALAAAGWMFGPEAMRWILAIGIPVAAAVLWGTFTVPEDPSRSGNAPVPVAGWVRLVVELVILGAGAVAVWRTLDPVLGLVLVAAIVGHYAASLDRVRWLITQ